MFQDRKDAGARLAVSLVRYKERHDAIVLALPRGGVVVGYEISHALNLPLDVFIVRKIGFPGEPELAIGALSETGVVAMNEDILSLHRVPQDYINAEIGHQKEEIARRVSLYRGGKGIRNRIAGRIVLLVDDGIATGATMKAAIKALKEEKIAKLVVALPVAPPEAAAQMNNLADEFICLETPYNFMAVGMHYLEFGQVSDEEVVEFLRRSPSARAA